MLKKKIKIIKPSHEKKMFVLKKGNERKFFKKSNETGYLKFFKIISKKREKLHPKHIVFIVLCFLVIIKQAL